MKDRSLLYFERSISQKRAHYPFNGQIELTYCCQYKCLHCYCKGMEDARRELSTTEFKKIFDEIHKAGTIWLTLTGGDPLVRDDFLELYAYARKKGFILSVFTNAYGLTPRIINYLAKFPPYSVEITVNSTSKIIYEKINSKKNSFNRAMHNIKALKRKGLPLVLKAVCLKENKDEIVKIKNWAEALLGRPAKNKYYFHYDPILYPRLNADKTPCRHRVSLKEMAEVRRADPDIFAEHQRYLHCDFPKRQRNPDFLYNCNSWMQQFFINPYGRLKFCTHSDKFSADLKRVSFREGFYGFNSLLKERFKTNSACRSCSLRLICYSCPAMAYLEAGDEEAPVPYFCRMAKDILRQMRA